MPNCSPKYRALNRAVGKAAHRYDLLQNGDRILVAISGGADSLMMMWMLAERLQRIPINFELFPVHIDPGFAGGFSKALEAISADAGYRLRVEYTDYGVQGHSAINRENPCFLCARLRRKRLFEIAAEAGCNKLALGHNKDDIIETLFLNMCYAGEISTMVPCQTMFKGMFRIIRPLAFADGQLIRDFACELGFPEFVNPCPSAGKSKRQEIKKMLKQLYNSNPKIKGNIFKAMSRVRNAYLLK